MAVKEKVEATMARIYNSFLDMSREQRTSIKAASSRHRTAQGEQSSRRMRTQGRLDGLTERGWSRTRRAEGASRRQSRCAMFWCLVLRRVGRERASESARVRHSSAARRMTPHLPPALGPSLHLVWKGSSGHRSETHGAPRD